MYRTLIKSFIVSIALLIGTSACVINQTVRAVRLNEDLGRKIVIVPEKEGVRSSFTEAYSAALKVKGLSVVEKPFGTPLTDYPLASTYVARWSWDLATYMSYAEIHIFEHGREIGHALYDSRMGGGRIDKKFINAEEKINELVDQLFPNGGNENAVTTEHDAEVVSDAD